MSDFKPFSLAVHKRLTELSAHELYVTVDGQTLWEHYLASFPPGTDPIYIKATEHTCSCCKNFVRGMGNAVAIVDGQVQTIWDIPGLESPYREVAASMDTLVRNYPITDLFRPSEPQYGAWTTRQLLPDGLVKNWNHFHGAVAGRHRSDTPDKARGDYRTAMQVFERALTELTIEAVDTTIELIGDNAIYRGAEFLRNVTAFRGALVKYNSLADEYQKRLWVWANTGNDVAHFRNSAIGTLVVDLSSGVDVEHAVRAFESKTAPTNYKRPTALITASMVKAAQATVEELGLTDALERRFANISDVSINNVLWANNQVKPLMKNGLKSLADNLSMVKTQTGKPENVGIDKFMSDILPTAVGMSLLVKGLHLNNLMSLTAPVHVDAGKLFKWDNGFGWSYNGNIADSIKEKVKSAGGNVTNAKMRVSLEWYNFDDLDIHIYEPGGNHIYFSNKSGKLDVDMNAGGGTTRTPVENVSWTSMADGAYRVAVNQYNQRETSDVGCTIEIENAGNLTHLSYSKAVKGMVEFARITVAKGLITKITLADGIIASGIAQEKWGVTTETYVPVQTLMYSPNYWDSQQVGNKHWFFILEGCKNPDPTRGIYNEFLTQELEKHRKVFEVLGDKTKCPYTDNQLSGVGFSSTRGDSVVVNVTTTKGSKSFNVVF